MNIHIIVHHIHNNSWLVSNHVSVLVNDKKPLSLTFDTWFETLTSGTFVGEKILVAVL